MTPAQLLAAGVDDWSGYGMVSECRASCGNPREVPLTGHEMLDSADPNPDTDAIDAGESYDWVIVGGGTVGWRRRFSFSVERAWHMIGQNEFRGARCGRIVGTSPAVIHSYFRKADSDPAKSRVGHRCLTLATGNYFA